MALETISKCVTAERKQLKRDNRTYCTARTVLSQANYCCSLNIITLVSKISGKLDSYMPAALIGNTLTSLQVGWAYSRQTRQWLISAAGMAWPVHTMKPLRSNAQMQQQPVHSQNPKWPTQNVHQHHNWERYHLQQKPSANTSSQPTFKQQSGEVHWSLFHLRCKMKIMDGILKREHSQLFQQRCLQFHSLHPPVCCNWFSVNVQLVCQALLHNVSVLLLSCHVQCSVVATNLITVAIRKPKPSRKMKSNSTENVMFILYPWRPLVCTYW